MDNTHNIPYTALKTAVHRIIQQQPTNMNQLENIVAVLGVTAGVTYTAESFRGLPWESALITAGVAAVLSVATSFGNPSFVAGKPKTTVVDTGLVPPDDGGMLEPHTVDASDPGMIEPMDDESVDYVPKRAAESEVGTIESAPVA